MPHFNIGTFGTTVAEEEGAFDRGVMVMHAVSSSGNAKKARRRCDALARFRMQNDTLGSGDNDDQYGKGANADPDPLLLGDSSGLQLIQILRELVQVLIREL